MFELSCQQSKNWLLLTAFVSLGEATDFFVVFKFYWFSLDLLFLLGQAKRYVKNFFRKTNKLLSKSLCFDPLRGLE